MGRGYCKAVICCHEDDYETCEECPCYKEISEYEELKANFQRKDTYEIQKK